MSVVRELSSCSVSSNSAFCLARSFSSAEMATVCWSVSTTGSVPVFVDNNDFPLVERGENVCRGRWFVKPFTAAWHKAKRKTTEFIEYFIVFSMSLVNCKLRIYEKESDWKKKRFRFCNRANNYQDFRSFPVMEWFNQLFYFI
mmetsp:Transcript_14328/g.22369  ORF Transcript_14328/g.22369 Transcript_14328/m.22369 type:complete len:143 (+) Transcript_14328:1545-1973(+)